MENVALPLSHPGPVGGEPSAAQTYIGDCRTTERAAHPSASLRRRTAARGPGPRNRQAPAPRAGDEPTGNLDATMGDEIGQLLSSYCRTEPIVIVATHNERLAEALRPRAVLIVALRPMANQDYLD